MYRSVYLLCMSGLKLYTRYNASVHVSSILGMFYGNTFVCMSGLKLNTRSNASVHVSSILGMIYGNTLYSFSPDIHTRYYHKTFLR
jgi:hypothetical protein